MLKYEINIRETSDDIVRIAYTNYMVYNYASDEEKLLVVCEVDDSNNMCYVGEKLDIINTNTIENNADDGDDISDVQTLKTNVYENDIENNTFSIVVPKYRTITLTDAVETLDEDTNKQYIDFVFDNGHYFNGDGSITLNLNIGGYNMCPVTLTDVTYVDCKTLSWEIDKTITNYINLYDALFASTSSLTNIFITVPQTLFLLAYSPDFGAPPAITVNRARLKINIPLDNKTETNLLHQDYIDNQFQEDETKKVIPAHQEMERMVYKPVILNEDGTTYSPITKINFNLHFRYHGGENWTVNECDGWNFTKFGYNQSNDRYFAYNNKSNQSDLLGYLGFTNTDVRNQKNKLQKSFIRLSFYDSTNPMNQNMLSYSTIFFDTNKLYSKYIRCQNLTNWFVTEQYPDNLYNNTGVNFEFNRYNSSIPVKIKQDDEKIEEYRLSTQFSVKDKYSSITSSEGFYLYLWADNTSVIPDHIYLKVEFNHAGYGRTIPMMAPYFIKDIDICPAGRTNLFKTNDDICDDWSNGGYGITKYNEYSYIRMKYMFDNTTKQYIYYIDPDYYGQISGPILNLNLYEAKITF